MTRTLITSLLAAVMLLTGMAGASSAVDDASIVDTADGPVRGTVTADHRIFQGIPYARPPIGDLRLRAPQPTQPWTNVRDATTPGPWCAQSFVYPPGTPVQFTGSEDCLYLNIHVPRRIAGPLPVMVFLHGGNAGAGSGYDPRPVTGAGGVIVVTINYRLGALGFLRHASLRDPFAGNFGLADQQAALRWVRRNIAAFGGDARNVTLWGESYGGFNVCAQLASPVARGLFDKAIVQSAPCGNDLVTRQEADRRGVRAVEDLGCDRARHVAACMRELPVERLSGLPNDVTLQRDIAAGIPWFPTAGTRPLPHQPLDAAQRGHATRVPMIHGGTRDEMRSVVAEEFNGTLPAEQYADVVGDLYDRDAPKVLARYPLTDYPSSGLALATLMTDEGGMVGACSQLSYNDAHTRRGPVYAYEFAEESDQVIGDIPLGAHHGIDIPYFFDSYLPGAPASELTEAQQELADDLISRWTTFARTGRPGQGWHTYRPGKALSLSTEQTASVDIAGEHACEFWRGLR
jgi:para-nitrobenzyl esterase